MRTINELTPTEFENLTFDLVCASGFHSVVWRTPGSDGGRDIEAQFYNVDASGAEIVEKWYIECKHYNSAISWPTVYHKIAHADAHQANFLLMVSNSNPSPSCEDEIANWNKTRYPKLRFWKGYQIQSMLQNHIDIGLKYQIIEDSDKTPLAVHGLLKILLGEIQSLESSIEFGQISRRHSKSSSSISSLISEIIDKYSKSLHHEYEKLTLGEIQEIDPDFIGEIPQFSSNVVMSLLYLYIVETASIGLTIRTEPDSLILWPKEPKILLSRRGKEKLIEISIWGNFDIFFGEGNIILKAKKNG